MGIMHGGQMEIFLGEEDGEEIIALQFPQPTSWLSFTKKQAMILAASIISLASEMEDEDDDNIFN